jgi:glycosyltransferase involved in cell wall biosynthesis
MDAGPWLAVPPHGYGGLENVVATLTAELRRRGHTVVLASVGDSDLPVDELVSRYPTGQFARLAHPYPQVVGVALAHAQVVTDTLARHAAAGAPFDLVHTHVEVVGPALLAGLGATAPPVLHTLHWDLARNEDFYAGFDGGGRVFFVGVSEAQVARAPGRLRRQCLAAVPLAVPADDRPVVGRHERRPDVVAVGRICALKGTAVALRAARAAGVPIVLAGPVAGCPDRAALDAALTDPTSPLHANADVRYFLEEVAPLLDGDRARWIGTVHGAAKDELVRRARAAVFPVQWEEPGGTAVCEALMAGTPVVALARGCLPSLVDPGVTGHLTDDEAGLVEALRRIDDLEPAACARDARRRFTPEVMATAYESRYDEVLALAGRVSPPHPRRRPRTGHAAGAR